VSGEEWRLLQDYKKTTTLILVGLKAEAVLLASQGAAVELIADFVERKPSTVATWLTGWNKTRLASIFTGHAGNLNASKLNAAQLDQVRRDLALTPEAHGLDARFWSVPSLAGYLSAKFAVVYDSPASYHYLLKFAGLSFKYPDVLDKRRSPEQVITERMDQIRAEIAPLLGDRTWEVFAADEVHLFQEAVVRKAWLRAGVKTIVKVDRQRVSQSYIGFLSQETGKCQIYRMPWQNGKEVLVALRKFLATHPDKNIAVVWDNASWHKTKIIREQLGAGGLLERVHLIAMPPYAPDYNPIEHVWNAAKQHSANIQRSTFDTTRQAFEKYIRHNTFPYKI